MGYQNAFIAVAEDCRADTGQVPPERANGPTAARVQYDMLASFPGRWTQEDVLLASSPRSAAMNSIKPSSTGYERSTSLYREPAYAPRP